MKKFLSIVLALALVVVMMVPTFAATITNATETTTATNENTETAEPETTTVEDGGETEDVEHRHSWEIEHYPAVAHLYCACGNFVVLPNDELVCEHDFVTEFDASCHWQRCIYCGYRAGTPHSFVDAFNGEIHETRCDGCGYTAGIHYGVEYTSTNEDTCHAFCTTCRADLATPHDWNGFMCHNCGRELSGPTGAIVKTISERDGYYRVAFYVSGERHYVNLQEVSFKEGDFVVIEHNGNEIISVKIIVDHLLIKDPMNFVYYIHGDLLSDIMEDINEYDHGDDFRDYLISDIKQKEDGLWIKTKDSTPFWSVEHLNVKVVDMTRTGVETIEVGRAYFRFRLGTDAIYICFM